MTEQDLDSLLLKGTGKTGEVIDLEQEFDDEEISPLIELIEAGHNGAREHEQQILKAGIQFEVLNTERDISDMLTSEILAQRIVEVRLAIAQEGIKWS